ncbi:MAG: hypothetical protein LBT47_09260 [Deltaproteobacteria bacterium]|jgi:hypothetical protein|nr:hypothetical protein [Deltaproteobacteria bacterium]
MSPKTKLIPNSGLKRESIVSKSRPGQLAAIQERQISGQPAAFKEGQVSGQASDSPLKPIFGQFFSQQFSEIQRRLKAARSIGQTWSTGLKTAAPEDSGTEQKVLRELWLQTLIFGLTGLGAFALMAQHGGRLWSVWPLFPAVAGVLASVWRRRLIKNRIRKSLTKSLP